MSGKRPPIIPSNAIDKPPSLAEVKDIWDSIAEDYAEMVGRRGNRHARYMIFPAMFELIGDVNNQKVLDCACGEGIVSRQLRELGADVTGLDISLRLINIGKKKFNSNSKFINSNATEIPLPSSYFDLVVINMALHDIEDYQITIREAERVLKNKGRLIFSITHPCFEPPGSQWLQTKEGLIFINDNYFNEVPRRFYFKKDGEIIPTPVIQYHRTLESYGTALLNNGFVITAMKEPKPIAETYKEFSEEYWGRENRIAFFLILACQKA